MLPSLSLSPDHQVAKVGEQHVGDGAEVLLRLVVTELHEDQLLVPDVGRAFHHQSFFLPQRVKCRQIKNNNY